MEVKKLAYKNSEGYNDSTAGTAITNAMGIKAGQIYSTTTNSGAQNQVVIMKVNSHVHLAYILLPELMPYNSNAIVNVEGGYVDVRRVINIAENKMNDYLGCLPDTDFGILLRHFSEICGVTLSFDADIEAVKSDLDDARRESMKLKKQLAELRNAKPEIVTSDTENYTSALRKKLMQKETELARAEEARDIYKGLYEDFMRSCLKGWHCKTDTDE